MFISENIITKLTRDLLTLTEVEMTFQSHPYRSPFAVITNISTSHEISDFSVRKGNQKKKKTTTTFG